MIERFSSGAPWEPVVGYSRAVRAGDLVFVAGCTGIGADGTPVSEDPAQQLRQALRNVAAALALADARLEEVVRTRMYVRDASQWRALGAVHAEVFGEIRPVTSMLAVAGFVDPALHVEVEADAFAPRA
ncbi:Rid family hydrolase [Conexibacter sp. SYSU D00693]|uniref:Rid family hydrolase n=1 Tax=Conexibacter sp. SYSU D00693 TaxID=2812560 RepID=UPI00196B2FE5|nr:Rid family hydrolase [Conexibacter sp. SYSU D00693]